MAAAWQAAAAIVKVFPGSLGGPACVRELKAPLADVPLLVTGGVDATNATAFLASSAAAVGAGPSLTRAPDLAAAARALVSAVRPPPQTR